MRISDWSSDVCSSDLIFSESDGPAHKTAKGTKVSVRTVKAPGFGPKGVLRCILPYTIFLKLRDMGGILPPYDEQFREVEMDRSEEHTSELQSLMRISYAVFCLKKKITHHYNT